VDGGISAPTFTDIYNNILLVHCGGSSCHNPATQEGVTYATQAAAYTSVKPYVTAGKGSTSTFYVIVSTGAMPPMGPTLSATDLSKIEAWINAGALNN
jgi:mono/diheme cytochrome c family protein